MRMGWHYPHGVALPENVRWSAAVDKHAPGLIEFTTGRWVKPRAALQVILHNLQVPHSYWRLRLTVSDEDQAIT